MSTYADRNDPSKTWNQNIIRNLKRSNPELINLADMDILKRYNQWTVEYGLSENDPEFSQFMLTGE